MTYQEFQKGLLALGYDLGPSGADGIPGRMSQAATISFKRKNGLDATTTVGPKTVAAITKAIADLRRTSGLGGLVVNSAPPAPIWVVEAGRFLGVAEVVGRGSNPTILGWAKRLGSKVLGMSYVDDDTPWCGLFVAACIATTLPGEPLPAVVVRAASWDKFGRPLVGPMLGAVARFQRPGGGHVGFVIGVSADGKLLRIRGGNQSNKVSDTWIEANRAVAYRWPSSGGNPRAAPIMDSRGSTISRDEA